MSNVGHVSDFIRAAFPSVWSLELLLLVRSQPDVAWKPGELVTQLRASEHVVDGSLRALVAGGLLTNEADGGVRYAPATRDIAALVDETAELYARRPDAVRRAIVFGASSAVQAFADAFKLRGD